MSYQHAIAVVTLAGAPTLRHIAQMLDASETSGMFMIGLSPTGIAPASHFINSGQMPGLFIESIKSAALFNTRAQAAFTAANVAYPYTLAQVTVALANDTISDGTFNALPETPHELIARLGLQMIKGSI